MSYLVQKIRVRLQNAVVTERNLYREGSITIGEDLLKETGLEAGEVVDVSNVEHTEWSECFIAKGKGREIVVNGSPARMFFKDDKISVIAYGYFPRSSNMPNAQYDLEQVTITLDGTTDNKTVTK